jgi:hypothetical protein
LTFHNLIDASNVSSASINISWTYNDEQITKITVNWKEAVLNKDEKTFRFENVSVPNRENDLVFKVFDNTNDTLSKFVYTIYYNTWTTPSNNSSWSSSNYGNPETYDVDGSQFTFTAPTTGNAYTTSEDDILIRWKVLAKWIDSVIVNNYKLSSYETSGWTWRYNARIVLNNLAEWTNIYTINYLSNWNIVYTNTFTIIKKSKDAFSEEVNTTLWSKENPEPDEVIVP